MNIDFLAGLIVGGIMGAMIVLLISIMIIDFCDWREKNDTKGKYEK